MRVTAGSNPDMKSFDGSSLGPIFRGHWVCGWMSIILYDLDQFLEVIPITDWKGWVGQGWWWWGGRGSCLPTFTSQRPNRWYELLDEIYSHFGSSFLYIALGRYVNNARWKSISTFAFDNQYSSWKSFWKHCLVSNCLLATRLLSSFWSIDFEPMLWFFMTTNLFQQIYSAEDRYMRNSKDKVKTETSHCSKQARVDGTTADMDFSAERLRE